MTWLLSSKLMALFSGAVCALTAQQYCVFSSSGSSSSSGGAAGVCVAVHN
jgi:hypothetical protein